MRCALVLAEGIFDSGETFVRHPQPSQLKSQLYVPLKPPRDVPVDVHIKVEYSISKTRMAVTHLFITCPAFSIFVEAGFQSNWIQLNTGILQVSHKVKVRNKKSETYEVAGSSQFNPKLHPMRLQR